MPLLAVILIVAAAQTPSSNLEGWAEVIQALGMGAAAIITAVALFYIRRVDKRVTLIDHAVNGKAPGDQPMVDQVQDLHSQIPVPLDQAELDQQALLPLVRHLVARVNALAGDDE